MEAVQVGSQWIGEGLLDGCKDIDEARDKVFRIIEDLKLTCLL